MPKKYRVFVSYSHEDVKFLAELVKMLAIGRTDLVFFDKESIKPGVLWKEELWRALEEAKVIFVIWCKHSAKSAYVQKEYQAAIEKGKSIVPVLLDKSALPEELAVYQWIDFRVMSNHAYRRAGRNASTLNGSSNDIDFNVDARPISPGPGLARPSIDSGDFNEVAGGDSWGYKQSEDGVDNWKHRGFSREMGTSSRDEGQKFEKDLIGLSSTMIQVLDEIIPRPKGPPGKGVKRN